jgi:myo-inositol-1(or 4)-monophosphatase
MMDAETLLKITNKVMEEISECISTDDEYYKIVGYNRQMGITRKMDLIAEEGLQRELVDHGICARIVSEELGDRVFPLDHEEPPQCTIVFDPVDGSTNAVHGIPFFCTSLAYSSKTDRVTYDDIDVGVVATISGKTYHAVRGEGAYINGIRIENRRAHVGKPIISLYTYGASWIPDGIKKLEQEAIIRILVLWMYEIQ